MLNRKGNGERSFEQKNAKVTKNTGGLIGCRESGLGSGDQSLEQEIQCE